MNRRIYAICILALSAGLSLTSCMRTNGSQPFEIGDLLLEEDFSNSFVWETYSDPARQIDLRVVDGAYRIEAHDEVFMWGLNAQIHTDVVMEVEAEQLSSYSDNAYGVMCRADPAADGDGYYFFISGDGYYTIRRGAGDEVTPLIQWTASSTIRHGQQRNRIRVVCIQDYLALYVNDQFVDETHDRRYGSGVAGFAAGVSAGGEVVASFDNLLIFAAHFAQADGS
ncbi:MAG: hypothetical protein IH587_01685 [Anaerolineae bacterium]|nr:hypothetical protein [Anaerolineae bacterium]